MLVPGKHSDLTQFIDVRDLSRFMVHCVEQNLTKSYNLVRTPMPFGEIIESCVRNTNPETQLTWVPGDFLEQHELRAWRELPMWSDADTPMTGSLTWSSQKAQNDGLVIRSVDETVRDTVAWFKSLPEDRQANQKSGFSREKEREVLKAWHATQV